MSTLKPYMAILLLAGGLMTFAGDGKADVYAVVIGIDRYRELPDIGGGVADATDLTEALRGAGAVVTTLLDEDASRESFLEAWRSAAASAGPGDVLMLSFAGHGIQVPDADGDEADGLDEAFVLPAFRPGARDDANLIRDDEIDRLTRDAAPRLVVAVADTCHSGTFTRAVDDRASFRAVRFVPSSVYGGDEALPGAQARTSAAAAEPAKNAVLFAAVPDHLQVQEVWLDGRPRGALSWAFARGIDGAADSDGDGRITLGELAAYVPETVRTVSESRQTPLVTARAGVDTPLFARTQTATANTSAAGDDVTAAGDATIFEPSAAQLLPLRLALAGPAARKGEATAERLAGVEIVEDPGTADLIWHLPSGDVLTSLGDVAARLGPAREARIMQGIVNKWRLLRGLERQIDGTLRMRVRPDDRLYHDGERATVEITSTRPGRLVLFDLAADGTAVLILPRPNRSAPKLSPQEPVAVPIRAGPPFGADHLVTVRGASEEAMAGLIGSLRAVHGRPLEAARLEAVFETLASGMAVLPGSVYTAP